MDKEGGEVRFRVALRDVVVEDSPPAASDTAAHTVLFGLRNKTSGSTWWLGSDADDTASARASVSICDARSSALRHKRAARL